MAGILGWLFGPRQATLTDRDQELATEATDHQTEAQPAMTDRQRDAAQLAVNRLK